MGKSDLVLTAELQLLHGKVVAGFGKGPKSSTAKPGLMKGWVKAKPDLKQNCLKHNLV